MMTLQHFADNAFQELLQQLYEQHGADALARLRAAAWEGFQRRGLPSNRDELFRYVGLRKFFQKRYTPAHSTYLEPAAIAPYILPECQQSVAVFVNGRYEERLSSFAALPGITALPLSSAAKEFSAFLNNQWQSSLKEESDPWALLNGALHPAGLFLYMAPKCEAKVPLQILSIIDAHDERVLIFPRYHLCVGAGSALTVAHTQGVLSGEGFALFPVAALAMEERARVIVNQLSLSDRKDSWCGEALRATLKNEASLDVVVAVHGGESVRHDYRVSLNGVNASANLSGLAFLDTVSEGHIHAHIDHAVPSCTSMQCFRNVLNDSSKASFEGKIFVHKEAQKTNAFQLCDNLLLSEGAQACGKPNLEIFADDVKASHGFTVGQLDDEQLFYLMARGLDSATSHHILIQGFCRLILDKLALPSLYKGVSRAVKEYIVAF